MRPKRLLPPAYFLLCLLTAVALDAVWPPPAWRGVGGVLLGAGCALMSWAALLFKACGTAIKPFDVPSTLVIRGPFCVSRNPMYVGLVTMLAGIAVLPGSTASLLAPGTMFVILQTLFIPHEERALGAAFGQAYGSYKRRVRRWL